MKRYKVNVDGQDYTVIVEEIYDAVSQKKGHSIKSIDQETVKSEFAKEKTSTERITETNAEVSSDSSVVYAPMPGSVIDVKVSVGDTVQEGDTLLILEAMKMENEITATISGKIKQVFVNKGDSVNNGDALVAML